MKLVRKLMRVVPLFVAALIAAGIVHICTVFALPYFYRTDAYSRLSRTLPGNSFVILPQALPKAQVLPYQLPDSRYAICRFDVGDGAMSVKAVLSEPGWTLSAYTQEGESFYAMPANEQRRTNVSLVILPPGDRFVGPLAELRAVDPDTSQVTAPTRRGLIVIQAPMKGRTYSAEIEQSLTQASCRKLGF
jgi:uncharacterized membrane protein